MMPFSTHSFTGLSQSLSTLISRAWKVRPRVELPCLLDHGNIGLVGFARLQPRVVTHIVEGESSCMSKSLLSAETPY